jgi:hypothetical protein
MVEDTAVILPKLIYLEVTIKKFIQEDKLKAD